MAEGGVPISQISQFLGYTNTKIKESVYARFSPNFFAPRRGGPKYVKGSAVIFLLWSAVQVYRFHCTIISIKSLKVLVGAARFELTTPSPPAMTSMRKLLETNRL